ncbi:MULTISPECIES: hypothetical protein [Streptomycetaceae]|nr:hypothetical protein [Streptantibioticus cattleyicolor]CCB75889.1 putative transmembrane protein [Streptantibioticus cattleyicolor NRRL 8057 = DSM 46488]
MKGASHLLTEDVPDFERVLDEALRMTAEDPAVPGTRLGTGQLRAMALSATAAISACAAAEYLSYVTVRARLRAEAAGGTGNRGPVTAGGGAGDHTSGAGVLPTVAVLTPILAGTAGLIFLLVGYVLAAMDPEPAIGAPLRTAGWLFLAVAGLGVVVGAVSIVLAAVRNSSSATRAARPGEQADLTAAREAWLTALLHRGMLPFLREVLAGAGAPPVPEDPGAEEDDGLLPPPRLGYSRPGFTGPGHEEPDSGAPRFSSPDYSSPRFSSPDFSTSEHREGSDFREQDPGAR